jgi:hypothetical protein
MKRLLLMICATREIIRKFEALQLKTPSSFILAQFFLLSSLLLHQDEFLTQTRVTLALQSLC